ncbi:hypothetical protein ACLMAL_25505 [Nocardia sp. CWNU-33]|uniref:hypothetical protein n=1 Tax=Nocardia sp. CWNU-33 TaxID=3392117 RepID=UPI00398E5B93
MGNLAELAGLDPQQLTADASPALRAALERQLTKSGAERNHPFNSYINPGR